MMDLEVILNQILDEDQLKQLGSSKTEKVADLWAGYGSVFRLFFNQNNSKTTTTTKILKLISPPSLNDEEDPDDSNKESDLRKRLSYKVESNFYQFYSQSLPSNHCHVSKFHSSISSNPLLSSSSKNDNQQHSVQALLISDFISDGFSKIGESRGLLNRKESSIALKWLAYFHAHFFRFEEEERDHLKFDDCPPPLKALEKNWNGNGVWQIGTYSYLQTRLSEFNSISSTSEFSILGPNSNLSFAIEHLLQTSKNKTLVHGDVKSANMAFSKTEERVTLYDFQYVGNGLGVQDLSKFLTTSISNDLLKGEGEEKLLKEYHEYFVKALVESEKFDEDIIVEDIYSFDQLLKDWKLAIVSWTRFQEGWGYWGNVNWIKSKTREILKDQEWIDEVLEKWKDDGSPKE